MCLSNFFCGKDSKMKTTILLLATAMAAFAQTPLPSNWIGAGIALSQETSPQINGWASYAALVSRSGGIYSFSSYDVMPVTQGGKFTIQTSTRSGFALVIRTLGPITILGFGDGGIAASSLATTGAYSGGGIAVWKLGSTAWTMEVAARRIKTGAGPATVCETGFGRSF
jgi:hypothetical protein